MSQEKSLLVIFKILRLLINTFTADEKYYLLNRNCLTQPIQMQLSQKQKTFSGIFFAFLIGILNFKDFQKKDGTHSRRISEITHSEKCT